MSYLSYISDENLEKHVAETLEIYRATWEKIDLEKFNSNIIDPIKLTFDSIVYKRKLKSIIIDEIARQRDKTNTNAIGYFNQKIFKYITNCTVPAVGDDIIFNNGTKLIYAEMKNKNKK
ncbi:MAG: Eco47II family restriction endonuclease [Christensenellaceae bacterium]|jgi:hypothetical protein|nr:Eco47II family restriction endonuclease [Christensenellaceae bacterium]